MPSKARTTSAGSEDAVRTRAYLLWEADGRPFGRDAHYWGIASAEVMTPAKPKRSAGAATPVKKVKDAKPVKAAAVKAGKSAAKSSKPAAKPKKK